MNTRQADRLIGVRGVLVDTYGDHCVATIVRRGRRCIYTAEGHVFDRSDIAEFHPL